MVPHAEITALDLSRALAVQGVKGILSARDFLPDGHLEPMYGNVVADQPVVALHKVRYVGEPIAAIAAHDIETARAAADLIGVEYRELPAAFSIDEAIAAGGEVIHSAAPLAPPQNICARYAVESGDVRKAMADADEIFEDIFETPFHHHGAMEPHVALAEVRDGRIEITTSTQTPFAVREVVARILRVPEQSVRVKVGPVGGSFGAKTYARIEPIVAALAWKTGFPVKLVLSREEIFATLMRHASVIRIRSGIRRNGRLVAREVLAQFNGGAYTDITPRLVTYAGLSAVGPYRVANVSLESIGVYTNLPPAGAFRGYGVVQAGWACESHMDSIATRLGMDPVELRMDNLLDDGDALVTGERLHGVYFKAVLSDASAHCDRDLTSTAR
jgi:CO/xanthine dehydrogenase Mo-binding subunit